MEKFAAVYTLGCRLNSADTGLIHARLRRSGYKIVSPDAPELTLIVINSCAVTNEAVRKSRQITARLRKKHPDAKIIISGCAARVGNWDNLADYIISDKKKIAGFLDNLPAAGQGGESEESKLVFEEDTLSDFPFNSRAFLKIQEGCNNFCSYCIVPLVRGRERSRSFDEVLKDAENLVKQGFPELILTGVNSCAYSDNGKTLPELIEKIAGISGDFRIRLSSTEPEMHNLELLEVMARPKNRICRFLHLSLQHGSDEILTKMRRRYSFAEYYNFVEYARKLMPQIHIGTDIIVGFPQESESNFQESCEHVRQIGFANTHIFSYSKREGTDAAKMSGQIPAQLIAERYKILQKIAGESKRKFAEFFLGKTLPVIFEEHKKDGFIHGWSDNYLAVKAPGGIVPAGKIVNVRLNSIDENNILVL